jgi:hypothetical protein
VPFPPKFLKIILAIHKKLWYSIWATKGWSSAAHALKSRRSAIEKRQEHL